MRNLSILLVVVTMVAATAGAQTIFSEDFSSGTLGNYYSPRIGYVSGTSGPYPYTHYATATNVVATRSGSDAFSMELHPLWPSASPKYARSEGYTDTAGQNAVSTNAQFTVEQWVYVSKAEIVEGVAVGGLWCNERTSPAIMRPEVNYHFSFQRREDPAANPLWPDDNPNGVGAWFSLAQSEKLYEVDMDPSMLTLRLYTEATAADAYTSSDQTNTYINTSIPTGEWIRMVVNHNLTAGTGANGVGTARAWGWKEDGTPLDWSGATISLLHGAGDVPMAISCGAFSNGRYIDGTHYIDDYVMTSGAAYNATLNGDLSGDGSVTGDDLDMILAKWGQAWTSSTEAGTGLGDPTMDGVVDGDDLDIILAEWGQSGGTPIPEPITLTLLGFGGLALLRRRR